MNGAGHRIDVRGPRDVWVWLLTGGLLFLIDVGCVGTPADAQWGSGLTRAEREAVATALPADAAAQLFPLSNVFYSRIASRRFNSRATFEDPSVRQFFQTVAGYSDYYAALVDALEGANIRYSRPTRIDLLEAEVSGSGNVLLKLRYVGRNDLPLRWWNASLVRTDEWSWRDGRWYVVPGKV